MLSKIFENGYNYITSIVVNSIEWYFDYSIIEDCEDESLHVVQCGKGDSLDDDGFCIQLKDTSSIEAIKQEIKNMCLPKLVMEYNRYKNEQAYDEQEQDLKKIAKAYNDMKKW